MSVRYTRMLRAIRCSLNALAEFVAMLSSSADRTRLSVASTVLLFAVSSTVSAQIKPAADAPKPHPPEESEKLFKLPAGFHIELVASEPWLADPVAIAFDARGRIFVCELHGYNLDGHYDVVELNKSGVLDRQVRRIPASPKAIQRAEQGTYGTVKLLEDLNSDGRIDNAKVWADHLPPAYGIVPARGGVIVTCAPDIIFLADRDGDGVAEERETLFTGFGVGELWTRISNPRHGPDNWIYAAMGHGSGGTIRGPHLRGEVRLGNSDFRFRADGSAIEPVTGGTGGFGLALTDFGDRFLLDNSHHARYAIPLPYRFLARNPYTPAPRSVENAADYTDVYPASHPHPWRLARSRMPEWVKFYGAHEAAANGNFTAVCGQLIYRAQAFPPQYRGNHFSCESQQNLIHRCLVERDGAGYRVRRPPGEEKTEFLTSTDGWFRPVNLTLGPDGALYIVDMYREIIEDYSAIPRFLQQQYGLITGADRGRIWRIVHREAPEPESADLLSLSSSELVSILASSNAWRRQTAQRLLIERRATGVAAAVRSVLQTGTSPPACLHALYTLEGWGQLDTEDLSGALKHTSGGVRTHAVRLVGPWLDRHSELLDIVCALVDDPDASVRLAVAMTLGESHRESAQRALTRLALSRGAERWMAPAILSSVRESAGRLLHTLLAADGEIAGRRDLIRSLSRIAGARHDVEEIALTLESVADLPANEADDVREIVLEGLLDGLGHGRTPRLDSRRGQRALVRILGHSSTRVRVPAFQLVRILRVEGSPALSAAFQQAARDALDATLDLASRRIAIEILAGAPLEVLEKSTASLLDPRQPLEIQLAAVRALSASSDDRIGTLLLEGWSGYTPKVQSSVLDAIFSHTSRQAALLEAVENETVSPLSIRGLQRAQLIESAQPAIRERAGRLLVTPEIEGEREQLLRDYMAVLERHQGDPVRGATVFREVCSNCHRVEGEGHQVGPDLSSSRSRADETLLRDLLVPGDQITIGFRSYVVVTRGGDVATGTLASEGATSVTLKKEGGEETTILRREILSMTASDASLMPENLDELITAEDAADVIAFLRSSYGKLGTSGVVLFDDEPEFPAVLDRGEGTVSLSHDDRHSGEVALEVTPLQRYSANIPGWNYRIDENPAAEAYRYLRLAWKTHDARGIMIELADSGRWPAADRPERRYFSGTNTTSWQAKRISETPPASWTVVTLDLWKDCGPFKLTGIAPTAMGGTALFDRIELLRTVTE